MAVKLLKMNMIKIKRELLFFIIGIIVFSSFVSAGIGIKWSQESLMVNENEKQCLASYSVYNPWPEDSYVTVGLGGELNEVLIMQETEIKLIPAYTSNENTIPVEFCFKVPKIYHRDCSVAGKFLCELKCEEEQKMYEGEVIVSSVPTPTQITGTGGSATVMSVEAPLRIRVACTPHPRDYILLYVLIAAICIVIIAILLVRKYRKPKVERDKEKIRKLRAELAKESRTKRKTSRRK